jgi:ketosteroid isomerase-like protein
MTSRIRSGTAAALAAGLAFAAGLSARPDAPADDALLRELSAVKDAIVAGHKAKDAAALAKLYADDYTAIDTKGERRTKSQLLASLPTDPGIVEGHYRLVAARRWGDVAVANGNGRLVYRDKDGSTRISEYDSVNVFAWQDGRWVYTAAFLP